MMIKNSCIKTRIIEKILAGFWVNKKLIVYVTIYGSKSTRSPVGDTAHPPPPPPHPHPPKKPNSAPSKYGTTTQHAKHTLISLTHGNPCGNYNKLEQLCFT